MPLTIWAAIREELADEVARKIKPVLGCTLQQVFGMAEGLLLPSDHAVGPVVED